MQEIVAYKMSGKPVKPYGVAWYQDQEAYEGMQGVCADMHEAPYETWRAAAQEVLDGSVDAEYGRPHVAVRVDPEIFLRWCMAQGALPDHAARSRYVFEEVEAAFDAALRAYKAKKKAGKGPKKTPTEGTKGVASLFGAKKREKNG